MERVRKGDDVVIVAGRDKGMRGKVLRVLPKSERVVVEGVNVITKHRKPTRTQQRGGIEKREAPIHLSNVMLIDPASGDASRTRVQIEEDGTKERIAVRSGNPIPKPE